jgi:curved DNA-binding protein CbpA
LKPLSISSSPSEIAVAYKSIALRVHPDKVDIDRDTFQTMRNHYAVLKDQYQIGGKKKTKLRK